MSISPCQWKSTFIADFVSKRVLTHLEDRAYSSKARRIRSNVKNTYRITRQYVSTIGPVGREESARSSIDVDEVYEPGELFHILVQR